MQSQNRMKRAAFFEASISKQPANTMGWLATTPTRGSLNADKAGDNILGIIYLGLKENAPSSATFKNNLFHVIGLVGVTGHKRI